MTRPTIRNRLLNRPDLLRKNPLNSVLDIFNTPLQDRQFVTPLIGVDPLTPPISLGAPIYLAAPIYMEGPIYMGTYPTDYSEILLDGTMIAHGEATCWRDELQNLTGAKLTSPSADFEIDEVETAIAAKISARYPTDYVSMSIQLNHDWVPGSAVHPHIHWWQTTANTPNWLIGYRWQRQGQAKTTAWTNQQWTSHAYVYPGAVTLNQITEFGSIAAPVGYSEVSDILQIRIYRDYTNVSGKFVGADPVNAAQSIVNLDIHMQVNMLGSSEEYIK